MATEAPQRRWQALCPNCGAPVEFASAASASAVCGFCRSTLVRDGETLRKIGVSAELIEDYSPLQLGASGRFAGEPFTIIGRLQHRYAEGSWNEWHALFDSSEGGSGKSAWLSEDNGSFVIAFEAPLAEAAPESLVVGQALTLAGRRWSVAALTTTTLAAAQGELPRPPALGREFRVAELRNAQDEVGSLEFLTPTQWSVGRAVRLEDLALRGLRDDTTAAPSLTSRALSCPNCGAPLEAKLGTTLTITCPQCRHVVDLSQGIGAELQHFAQSHGGEPQIPLGRTGTLAFGAGGKPAPWQVVGFQERCDIPEPGDDDETTLWREYLLFNRTEGFVFLVDAEDGWSLVRPLTGAPDGTGNSVSWQGRSYRLKYRYAARTTYVLGEFYWRVQRDERAEVADYESSSGGAGRALLSREQTASEVSWSQGFALDAAVVQKAFGLPQDQLAALERDAKPVISPGRVLRWLFVIFIVLPLLAVLVRACSRDDCQRYADSFGTASAEYQQCVRSNRGGFYGGAGGGSYGGYSSGGGGHK